MIEFEAEYFDGAASKKHIVRITVDKQGGMVLRGDAGELASYMRSEIKVLAPVGSTERIIRFPKGAQCLVEDHEAVRLYEQTHSSSFAGSLLHYVERNAWAITGSALVLIALGLFAFFYGIPWVARDIALRLDQDVRIVVTDQAMSVLDKAYFEPSEMDEETHKRIRGLLADIAVHDPDGHLYNIVFRKSSIGPNAFALPDGTILITDEIVELAENDEQIFAVIGHEIWHIKEQHGMRMLLQQIGLLALLTAMTGDVTTISSAGAAIPHLLATGSYSREFETDADLHAARCLKQAGLSTEPMQRILYLMHMDLGFEIPFEDYISTHPSMAKRIENMQNWEKAQGIAE